MKKVLIFISCLLLCVILSMNNQVHATSVVLNNMDITTKKIRDNGDIKVQIELTFETDTDIIIKGISSTILGQTQQSLNVTQMKSEITTDDTKTYLYNIIYVVEYWQIGTMSLKIEYVNTDDFTTEIVDFYISGGKWQSSEISWESSIVFGVFAAFMIGLATLIIIDSSRKGFMDILDE